MKKNPLATALQSTVRLRSPCGTALFVARANERRGTSRRRARCPKEDRKNDLALKRLLRVPQGSQKIIFADPPWDYGRREASQVAGCAMMPHGRHYNTMCLDDICELPVARMAAEDCELWLWVPQGLLLDGIAVATAWGFREVVGVYSWHKQRSGVSSGAVLPAHELLIRFRKGAALPFTRGIKRVLSALTEQSTAHSVKPTYFQDAVDLVFPDWLNRIELFGRKRRRGWKVWGNEVSCLGRKSK